MSVELAPRPVVTEAAVPASPAPETGRIEVDDLSLYYGAFRAVRDVSMTIRPRSVTAIIGPSGCGKTTFLRALNRMHELALGARSKLRSRANFRIHGDPHAYFVEAHPTEAMPWFMGPVGSWFARFAHTPVRSRAQADGGTGRPLPGVGTPAARLAKYLGALFI